MLRQTSAIYLGCLSRLGRRSPLALFGLFASIICCFHAIFAR